MKGSNDTWLGGRIAMSIPTWYQHASTLRWAQVKAACRSALGLSILVVLSLFVTQHALAAKCLYISSYHRGYAWSDGLKRAYDRHWMTDAKSNSSTEMRIGSVTFG
jgi:hypothetical protein